MGSRELAEIRVTQRNFMRLAKKRTLQEPDHAVRLVVNEKYLDRQIILRQCSQFVGSVLKPAIAGNAYNPGLSARLS